MDIIAQFLDTQQPEFSDQDCLLGLKEFSTYLYRRNAFPRDCLGPCRFSFLPRTALDNEVSKSGVIKVWMWVHPAIYSQVLKSLREAAAELISYNDNQPGNAADAERIVAMTNHLTQSHLPDSTNSAASGPSIGMVPGGLVRFCIRGKQSERVLARVFRPDATLAHSNNPLFEEVMGCSPVSAGWGADYMIGLTVQAVDRRETKEDKNQEEKCRKSSRPSRIRWSVDASGSPLWRGTRPSSLDTDICTDKKPFSVLLIRRNMCFASGSASNPSYLFAKKGDQDLAAPWNRAEASMRLSGWDIICSPKDARPLWMALIYAGCRAVGLWEMGVLDLEGGSPAFPRDFPDTKAGRDVWRSRVQAPKWRLRRKDWKESRVNVDWRELQHRNAQSLTHVLPALTSASTVDGDVTKSNCRPVRCRTKWGATGYLVVRGEHTSAFLVPSSESEHSMGGKGVRWTCPPPLPPLPRPTLINVRLWAPGRGVPVLGSRIYAPNSEDISQWLLGVSRRANRHQTATGGVRGRPGLWRGREYTTETEAGKDSRTLLGFVCSGGVSVLCGRGVGIGLCHAETLHSTQRKLFEMEITADASDVTRVDAFSLPLSKTPDVGLRLSSLVIFLSPSSTWCRPAMLEIIPL